MTNGCEDNIYYIRGDGGTINLTDGVKYDVLMGVDGRWMPPFEYTSEPVYTYPGEVLRLKKTKPRDITLPLIVKGTDASDLRANIRALNSAFSYDIGQAKLKVEGPDGAVRMIPCYYADGMTFLESADTGNPSSFYRFVATFICHDPYWFDPLENEYWQNAATTGEMGVSNLNTTFKIYNAGDVPTWPIWTLTGAFTEVEIQNLTTGSLFDLEESLATSQRVYIDTRPGYREVMRNHITPDFGNLTTDSELFPLMPGKNVISPLFADGDANSELRVRWVNKYLGI